MQEYQVDTNDKLPRAGFYARHWLHIAVCFFVIGASFLYGLKAGFEKGVQPANASLATQSNVGLSYFEQQETRSRNKLLSSLQLAPVGQDITINGQAAEVYSFLSDRDILSLTRQQQRLWEMNGYEVHAMLTDKRTALFARDDLLGRYLTFITWLSPPSIRNHIIHAEPVHGMITISTGKQNFNASPDEMRGEIPGIPIMHGGVPGSVFSSSDKGGRSYSSVYTLDTNIENAYSYYENELSQSGWQIVGRTMDQDRQSASISFKNKHQEAVILFGRNTNSRTPSTLAFVSIFPTFTMQAFQHNISLE